VTGSIDSTSVCAAATVQCREAERARPPPHRSTPGASWGRVTDSARSPRSPWCLASP